MMGAGGRVKVSDKAQEKLSGNLQKRFRVRKRSFEEKLNRGVKSMVGVQNPSKSSMGAGGRGKSSKEAQKDGKAIICTTALNLTRKTLSLQRVERVVSKLMAGRLIKQLAVEKLALGVMFLSERENGMSNGLCSGYYIQGQYVIIMIDVASKDAYENVSSWHCCLVGVCKNIPTILSGNKKKNFPHYNVSAKPDCSFEKPFLWLAKEHKFYFNRQAKAVRKDRACKENKEKVE